MSIEVIVLIVWMHFITDFVLQSDWMAQGKSKDSLPLLVHVSVYTVPFVIFGPAYALVNGVAHLATDWCTSRACSALWQRAQRHWFFVVLGLDQAVHMTTLFVTYKYMVGG